jgi:uncharacterized protein (UPF0332 family)
MAKSKKDRLEEAQAHLARARDQFDRASVDSWEPADPAECVTKCFYSYENALVAAATALGTAWTKKHYEKAALAKKLFEQNKLKTDVSDRLVKLNELRKDVSYGDPGEELSEVDLEDLVSELEGFLDEVRELVTNLEED